MVARWAHNPKVIRSNRVPATQKKISILLVFFYRIIFIRKFAEIKIIPYLCTRNTEQVLTKIAGWSSGSSLGS